MVDVNYLAILVCGIAAMALGTLWYGPLFGKAWMAMVGHTQADMEKAKADPTAKRAMFKSYAIMFVGALVMAYVLAHFMTYAAAYLGESAMMAGIMCAIWAWLGFVATTSMGSVLWENRPWKYWFITSGYYLVQLIVMGTILALMM